MGKDAFIEQLKALGLVPSFERDDFVVITYEIPVGRFIGKTVKLGLKLNADLPMSPPSGPHFSPHLLPINPRGGPHPSHGVHDSPLGTGWQYWSRPFGGWAKTDRTAKAYMAHIAALLNFP